MRISRSLEIPAPPAKVWPHLVRPERILEWCSPAQTIRFTSTQESGLGTLFYFEEKVGPVLLKLNLVVTRWIVNECVAFKMTSGNFVRAYEQTYSLEPTFSGCRCTIQEQVILPHGILGEAAGLFRKPVSEALLENMLSNLKNVVET
jgi:hypothetical protein